MKLFLSAISLFISVAVFGQSKSSDNTPKLGEAKVNNNSEQVEKTNATTPTPKLSMTSTETSEGSGSQSSAPVVLPQKPAVFSVDKIDPKGQPK